MAWVSRMMPEGRGLPGGSFHPGIGMSSPGSGSGRRSPWKGRNTPEMTSRAFRSRTGVCQKITQKTGEGYRKGDGKFPQFKKQENMTAIHSVLSDTR